jgi:chromosome segregation protein
VHFSRLRLSGFKSFVDPIDFRIEGGLTGIVGPNGCGKSNLLEALRWVMGANSAKALRGEGMDDIIFSGCAERPARNHAEVSLTIDNADFDAPVEFNTAPVIEVVRRIDRGEGSRFRINGREVRARDVQLLFADSSTGANSPALVRQGQISELIASRPQNRRRILEEAAGISGLHSRRHEVELRVRAAETNLTRLDDVMGEVEANLGRLRREARYAERYRRYGAEIRSLQGAVLYSRWSEAEAALRRVQAEFAAAETGVEETAREAAAALVAASEAEARIRPRREEEAAIGAALHRLSMDGDRLERSLKAATVEIQRLATEIVRIDGDAARERQIVEDAGHALSKTEEEASQLEGEAARSPHDLPRLQATAADAEAMRAAAEGAVEALAAEIATASAEARAATAKVDERRERLARSSRALAQAKAELQAVDPPSDAGAAETAKALANAKERVVDSQRALELAEETLSEAIRREDAARDSARLAQDGLAGLIAEARGLASAATSPTGGDYPPALELVCVPTGLEAALAAALGDDLDAAVDARAARHWAGRTADGPTWPDGVSPLAPLISAPPQLAARLAFTGLVERSLGPRLQASLPTGARLVSRQGDLWRWDGFVCRAEAPRPAQVRLEQRARLAAIERQIESLTPALREAEAAQSIATTATAQAQDAARLARKRPVAAGLELTRVREIADALEREAASRRNRVQSLDETIVRLQLELDEETRLLAVAQASAVKLDELDGRAGLLAHARAAAARARDAATAAKAALDVEIHERNHRQRRLEVLSREQAEWSERAATANQRLSSLTAARALAAEALVEAQAAPASLEAQWSALQDEIAAAQERRVCSSGALNEAERLKAEADRRSRAADAAAADAREARATFVARLAAAKERTAEHAAAVREATGLDPAPQTTDGALPDRATADMEERLAALEREREALGPVNLRAEDEMVELSHRFQTMRAERSDLAGALARLRQGLAELNVEGRRRLTAAFEVVDAHFRALFTTLFDGGQAELRLVEADDPLEAGLEIFACPPGKRMAMMSLMSGGEQALTAIALIFAVFLANPAPICFLDEVDAPLDDANVDKFCDLLQAMRLRSPTRFIAITHNSLTMSRMDRLFGVTMPRAGLSQLVSVDLRQAEALAAQ